MSNDPFCSQNESELREKSLKDGWQRYVIVGQRKTGCWIYRSVIDPKDVTPPAASSPSKPG